ncbi:MAG TPA: protein kinase [Thermoanaerobaculia bacterium]|nr:protein kinase [Thermoanaerobaculia bacterium]
MLDSGTRLGPYRIDAQIGAGGMGQVYRARDTRLDRTVAIKVLPADLARSAQLRLRFEREAKAISSLNHPNICTLHDVGEADGIDYIVMEYLEGDTLADRVARGPMPIDQVLRYGIEIADALEKAHRSGIVHRDLKPSNVIITKGGAKLVDFGLAKRSLPIAGVAHSTTQDLAQSLTSEGAFVGTYYYMSPESFEGVEADARTDIFAFGAVLYEMATGKRAFDGGSRASLIAQIVAGQPKPISQIQPHIPAALEHVVAKCIEKNPDERWQSAHDVKSELEWVRDRLGTEDALRPKPATHIPLAIAAILGALVASIAMYIARPQSPPRITRSVLALPLGARFRILGTSALAVSPDGSRIVYIGEADNDTSLYMLRRDQFAPVQIPGTRGARSPFFSPDGQWLAYAQSQKMKRIPIDFASAPLTICDAPNVIGASWVGDTIWFVPGFSDGVWSVPASGGERKLVVKPDAARRERALLWPQLLPGGKSILLTIWTGAPAEQNRISVWNIEKQTMTTIQNGSSARYSPSGHLLYARSGSLQAVPFDAKSLRTTGAPRTVIFGVASGFNNYEAHYALAADGTLVYVPGTLTATPRTLRFIDTNGIETNAVPTKRRYANPHLLPDGRTVILTLEEETYNIWMLDLDRDLTTRVTFSGDDRSPLPSPDGRQIAFVSGRTGTLQIFLKSLESSAPEVQLTSCPRGCYPNSWTPDGKSLLYVEVTNESDETDIKMMPIEPRGEPHPVIATEFDEGRAQLSPDGSQLAYASNESGEYEVYAQGFPNGRKVRVSTSGGNTPRWSFDGRHLYYSAKEGVMVVDLDAGHVSKPRIFIAGRVDSYQPTRDGRVLIVRADPQQTVSSVLHRVEGFDEELRRRVKAQ